MATKSISFVAEQFNLTVDQLREFIEKHKLPIGGNVRVLTDDKVKAIEEKMNASKKQEKKADEKPKEKPKAPVKQNVVFDTQIEEEAVSVPKQILQEQEKPVAPKQVVITPAFMTPKDLGDRIKTPAADIIKKLFDNGIMMTLNQEIDFETAAIIADEFGYELQEEIVTDIAQPQTIKEYLATFPAERHKHRGPVVTIMGHVDHGKTTLLDTLRKTRVAEKEVGGITQKIGAYQIEKKGKKITFLDTPGHEAFTEMRARGADVTDVAVLIVAADDGVKPQTIEAINHIKAAGVPMLVAINKIDKPGADSMRVKKELTEYGVLVEEWGGDTVTAEISAKENVGLDELMDMIILMSDMQDLTSVYDVPARGTIIESRLDKGKGPLATVLVQVGELQAGNIVVIGTVYGKVRALADFKGKKIRSALPSVPAEIFGLEAVPPVGEQLEVFTDEKAARDFIAKRKRVRQRNEAEKKAAISLEEISTQVQEGVLDELRLIIKADSVGSLEAIKASLAKLITDEINVAFVHTGVGDITNSDVALASASKAIVIGFTVKAPSLIQKSAEYNGVDIHLYTIIYDLIDDIKKAIEGILRAKPKEILLGKFEVKKVFATYSAGVVVGGMVEAGFLEKGAHIKVMRADEQIGKGTIKLLKRLQDEVPRVEEGLECGMEFHSKLRKLKEGDLLEAYRLEGIHTK